MNPYYIWVSTLECELCDCLQGLFRDALAHLAIAPSSRI